MVKGIGGMIGDVATAPFRGARAIGRGVWDLVTVDDEERAARDERRSDRDFAREGKRRMDIIQRAQELGIEPGVLIDAEMLGERKRENTLYTMENLNAIAEARRQAKQDELDTLMQYLASQQGQRPGLQQPQAPMAQSQLAKRGY